MKKFLFTLTITTILTSGCATHHPQTAEEFRQAAPDAFMGKKETFEVNRAFKDVARTFQQKAPQCLNVRVKTVSQTTTSYQVLVTKYKPTVLVSNQRAELHIQQHHESGVVKVTKEPEGGYYLVVTDAYPISKNKTKIVMYRPSMGYDVMIKAIKGWASGTNTGCPDMTKI